MGKVTILPGTTLNPITKIGEMAGVCWGANTSSITANYQRGWDCIISGHGRTLEYPDIYMFLDGYSARVIREWYTHIGCSPTRLQASTRYINYDSFKYVIPPKIKANKQALQRYECAMKDIQQALKSLESLDMPREDIALLLPLGMTTKVVDKRNLRNLIDISHQRLCNRAYWEFQQLMYDICDALTEYGADSGEWETIVKTQMKPKCEISGFCSEKKSCGRKPKRDDVHEAIR